MIRKSTLFYSLALCCASAAIAQTRVADNRSREGRSTQALLNERIPEVSFEEASFERVMEWVGDFTGANVVVRWQTLEDSGIDRDRPISIRVRDLRLSQVLWMIMNEASGSDLKLAYRASGNLIVLSTEEDLGKEMVTLVYDISDLLVRVPRFTNAAQLDPAQALQGLTQGGGAGGVGGGGGGGGGGGQQLFQNTNQGNEGDDAGGNEIEELIDLIRQTIEPDSWQENGGNGSIRAFRNLLIVRNTLLVHQRINGPVSE
ncbi:MAG: hypothetical protein AB7N71_02985 [Phycisphaerae bacterium]